MITKEQSERSEEAFRALVKSQLPAFTNHLLENLFKLSQVGERWPTKLLLILGALLLGASLLMKINYPYGIRIADLSPIEFTTLIFAAMGLLLVGALFSLIHAWSWRRIIHKQQAVGVEILHKQLDIEKELLTGKDRHQAGEMFLLPLKIRKRHRR